MSMSRQLIAFPQNTLRLELLSLITELISDFSSLAERGRSRHADFAKLRQNTIEVAEQEVEAWNNGSAVVS